jgi:hypothetical protein
LPAVGGVINPGKGIDMTHPNRANYDLAASIVAAGDWRVDADAGLLCGRDDRPIGHVTGSGYLQVTRRDPENRGQYRAAMIHRVIWEAVHGPIPDHLTVNHINGVKTDNRIANLELLTQMENNRHAIRTGLRGPAPRGDDCTFSTLTGPQACDIYSRVWAGERQKDLAAEYGVTQTCISDIKLRKTWRHIQASGRL